MNDYKDMLVYTRTISRGGGRGTNTYGTRMGMNIIIFFTPAPPNMDTLRRARFYGMNHGPFRSKILKPELCWSVKVPPVTKCGLELGEAL